MTAEAWQLANPGLARALEVEAPAKVNLWLRVGAREPSGYHRIETLFQALELADGVAVELRPGEGVGIEVTGHDVGPPNENLAARAAHAFLAAAREMCGVHIRLLKRIPPGTGLGGGSSDAAAVLGALDTLLPGRIEPGELARLAAGLGSDVPFFLCGSPLAVGGGRGEVLEPLSPLPSLPVIVGFPGVHVSTREAYAALDRRRERDGRAGGRVGGRSGAAPADWETVRVEAVNDFEEVVPALHPAVARVRDALAATAPLLALLSGSGSAVFAIYGDDSGASRALADLAPSDGVSYVLTRTRVA